jgi:hypothetical protein
MASCVHAGAGGKAEGWMKISSKREHSPAVQLGFILGITD